MRWSRAAGASVCIVETSAVATRGSTRSGSRGCAENRLRTGQHFVGARRRTRRYRYPVGLVALKPARRHGLDRAQIRALHGQAGRRRGQHRLPGVRDRWPTRFRQPKVDSNDKRRGGRRTPRPARNPRSADTDAITPGRTVTAAFQSTGTFSACHPPLPGDWQQVSAHSSARNASWSAPCCCGDTSVECCGWRRLAVVCELAPRGALKSDHVQGSAEPRECPHSHPRFSSGEQENVSQVLQSPRHDQHPRGLIPIAAIGVIVSVILAVVGLSHGCAEGKSAHTRLSTGTRSYLRQLPPLSDDRAGRGRQASAGVTGHSAPPPSFVPPVTQSLNVTRLAELIPRVTVRSGAQRLREDIRKGSMAEAKPLPHLPILGPAQEIHLDAQKLPAVLGGPAHLRDQSGER